VTRSSGVATNYGYDGAGRLSAVSHTGPTGTLQSYVYALDANGNRTGVTTQAGSEGYTYDALNRLTSVSYANGDTVSYGYDAAGKRLTETVNGFTTAYLYDAAGQVVSNGVLSYTYDANGNLTGAGSDAYAWDWANRLVGASVGSSTIAYSYDALGVRTGAVVDGVASSLLWDRVTGQLVDDGGQGYVHAPGVLAQLGVSGRGDLLTDGTGSVRGVTDASGALVGSADFGVFGQKRGQSGVASSIGSGGVFWTAALRDQSQAPAGLVSAALLGALPTPSGGNNSSSVSTALAHLERLQQINPAPNRFVGSAEDTDGSSASWGGGFGGGGAPVGSPALAQTSDPEPANQAPGPYTYANHRPMQGNGGTSALPGGDPGLFAAWLLGLEANEDPTGLVGLGQAIARVFLYVACVLDGECLASLTELQALGEELGSSALESLRWTGKLLSRAADLWPLLPNIPRPLAELMSLGLGFVPVVGDLYDLLSGITGYDVITGEHLPDWARAVAIGAAFMPLVSSSNLRISAKVIQWSDDVRTLFRTGIWGGTIRRIGRALPEGFIIGVRGRPVMAALWEAIYRHTGWFVPKPKKEIAEDLSKLKFLGFDTGLRKMRDKNTGKVFLSHSDIDIQVIARNGAPMDPNDVRQFVRDLNTSIGGYPL
jgi:YD repeat-containing protein